MSVDKKRITLVMVCDNNLVVMLAALLRSIEDNHLKNELVDIYIVSDKISYKNIKRLKKVICSDKICIIWKEMNEVIPNNYHFPLDRSNFPLNAYVRLFLFNFLPLNLKKAIYLDVDMIVLDDITNLWNVDLQGYPIAAVRDKISTVSEPDHGILNYRTLGLSGDTKYFNSGMLVFDLDAWRDGHFTRKVLEIIEENKTYAKYPDQYGLNVAFANNWMELNKRWNHFANWRIDDKPSIIHFISIKPLYKGYTFDSECRDIFYRYLSLTPWRKYKPKGDYHWKLQQFRNRLSKQTNREILNKILHRIKLDR